MAKFPFRIESEIRHLTDSPIPGIEIQVEKDPIIFRVLMTGPENTPYEGGIFKIDILFPDEYPLKAPTINFRTKIYHPNVSHNGDFRVTQWSPTTQIRSLLKHIRNLMITPNIIDSCNPEVGMAWKIDPTAAIYTAKQWTNKYAME